MSFLRRLPIVGAACVLTLAFPGIGAAAGPDEAGHTYEVVAGDSWYGIAHRHGVSVGSLLDANDLALTSVILPGQQLNLPAGATTPTQTAPTPAATTTKTPTANATYTVTTGDSLYGIATRHGVKVSSLMAANNLALTSVILPGQQLNLPAGATTPTQTAPTPPATTDTPSTNATYTVTTGDSLYGIATRHRTRVSALLEVNHLTLTSVILPGQQLALPADAVTPAAAPASTPSAAAGTATSPASSSGNSKVDAVVAYAQAQIGRPYEFFTRGPDTFDCSGLTLAAYAKVGISLVHYSASQALQGRVVNLDEESIQAGDLLFFKRRGSNKINHVGIATSSTTWIQAIGPGESVRASSIPPKSTISAVRRLIES